MTAMSEAYEQMTDTAEQAMDMYDQIAEWCAVLESCAESTDHSYQHQKLTEIAEHLRRLRARQREGEREPDGRIGPPIILDAWDVERIKEAVEEKYGQGLGVLYASVVRRMVRDFEQMVTLQDVKDAILWALRNADTEPPAESEEESCN